MKSDLEREARQDSSQVDIDTELSRLYGQFHGFDWTNTKADVVYVEAVAKPGQKTDLGLIQGAWFDYRTTHPAILTQLFIECFRQAWWNAYGDYFGDRSRAMTFDPIGKQNAFNLPFQYSKGKRRIDRKTGFFKKTKKGPHKLGMILSLRRYADELCMPYEIFCRGCIHYLMEYTNWQEWPSWETFSYDREVSGKIPTLHHMNRGSVLVGAQKYWEQHLSTQLVHARSCIYLVKNRCNHPWQKEHANWLFRRMARKTNPAVDLAKLVYKKKILTERDVLHALGHNRRAVRLIEKMREFKQHLIESS